MHPIVGEERAVSFLTQKECSEIQINILKLTSVPLQYLTCCQLVYPNTMSLPPDVATLCLSPVLG